MRTGSVILISLVLVLASAVTGCPPSQVANDSEVDLSITSVTIIKDIEYGRVDGRPLLLDI
jgi:hypothetical protein